MRFGAQQTTPAGTNGAPPGGGYQYRGQNRPQPRLRRTRAQLRYAAVRQLAAEQAARYDEIRAGLTAGDDRNRNYRAARQLAREMPGRLEEIIASLDAGDQAEARP